MIDMDNSSKCNYATDILIYAIDSRTNDNCRGLPQKYFSILLIKRDKEPFKNSWCLPGGFVRQDETSFEAAMRVLKKETNLTNIYVEQLGIFDEVKRDPRGRVVSTAYVALIDKNSIKDKLSDNARWFDIDFNEKDKVINLNLENEDKIKVQVFKKLINKEANQYLYSLKNSENIMSDHGLIITRGIIELRKKAETTDIVFNLMPKEFTVGELKQVYEIILGKKLINSAFRRVIGPKIQMIEEQVKTGGHRPSNLFKYIGKEKE